MLKINYKDLVLCLILIIITIFSFNNDFIYKNEILKINDAKIIKEDTDSNTLGLVEKKYTYKITGVITNGKNKGNKKEIEHECSYSNVYSECYNKGDKVFLDSNNIGGLKRDSYLVIMLSIFIMAIYLLGKKRGFTALFSVIINITIFLVGLELYFKGFNLLIVCIFESIIYSTSSLLLAGGINKKTYVAIISTIVSTFILFILSFIVVKLTNYNGINFNEVNFLTVPIDDIILVELLLGGLGAIMDVSITVSSSINELVEKKISKKELIKSGKIISSDILSTMVSVLFFTYLSSGLPVFVLAIRNGFSFINYILSNFSLEITRFLIGSIGILLAIPISLFISIKFYKRGDINE